MLRCPGCRTRRTTHKLLTRHIKGSGCSLCTCGGYHYVHRPGSPCCEQNPYAAFHEAARRGEDEVVLTEILMDIRWNHKGKVGGAEAPF